MPNFKLTTPVVLIIFSKLDTADRVFAEIAKAKNLGCTIFGEPEVKQMGMGGLAGVSAGAAADCKFVILEYKTTGTGNPWIHISFNKAGNRAQVFTFMNDKNCKGPGVVGLYDLSNS